jgi:predicted CXXCH cytochrome family protein
MKRTAIALGIITLFLVSPLAARTKNPHNFKSVGCKHCHIVIPGQSEKVRKMVFRKNIDYLCQECHAPSLEDSLNHRVGIRPSMKVPADLYLSPNGELSCVTCHNPHLAYLDSKTKSRTYFLRRGMLKMELCLACHGERSYQEPPVTLELLAPLNNSIFNALPVPVIGKVPSSKIKEVVLKINDARFTLNVRNRVFSTILTLQEGINNIQITAPENSNVAPIALNLYYKSDISAEMTYRLYFSHGIISKKDCYVCHEKNSNSYLIPEDNSVLCAKCHERKISAKYIHGPVAVGSCTVCHDPHGQNNPAFLVKTGEELCFLCHEKEDSLKHLLIQGSEDVSILRKKDCGYCHDPHQGDRKFRLRIRK